VIDTADPATDEAVLAGLAEDLDAGFAELVRGHQQVVYAVALRVSGRPQDAEDLAAEAFLRAYRALRGYDAGRIAALRPRAWLCTIVLNTWRNAVRDAARRPRQAPLAELADPPAAGPGVAEQAEANEGLRALAALVAELPEAQRVAVVLRHVVGLSTTEVAAAMGCPEGTAKSHISRGLRRLRATYTGSAADDGQPVPVPGRER
jgi:RNA polymerase sigma factor (sigma-70 family)